MKKIIIFDLFRTLYDPDNDELFLGTKEVLVELKRRGFTLVLLTREEPGRNNIVHYFGLNDLFDQVIYTRHKSQEEFEKIIKENDADRAESYVVGDVVREEIVLGNQAGLKTVWLCAGKFSAHVPTSEQEKPMNTIFTLPDLLDIIK